MPLLLIFCLAIIGALPATIAHGAELRREQERAAHDVAAVGPRTAPDGDRALRVVPPVALQALKRSATSGPAPAALWALSAPLSPWHDAARATRANPTGWLSRATVADSGQLGYFPTAPPLQG